MSQYPNPFGSPHLNSSTGMASSGTPNQRNFLLITRPPLNDSQRRNSMPYAHPPPMQNNQHFECSPYNNRGRFSPAHQRGRDRRSFTPRFNQYTPYRQQFNKRSFHNTPRNNFHSYQRRGQTHNGERGPLSDIPIEKFISPNMVKDPWLHLQTSSNVDESTADSKVLSSSSYLENTEIIIDSAVCADLSQEDSISVIEDPNSGSKLNIQNKSYNSTTTSTSEKDTGSSSES